ncbi:hypothetical protein [Anatilimnocola floriformis]|uniref:hypothetical protein n=1 Tax=Anatilimnocola floriformis TaxID=2948575 RepID=UPI0020C507CB|nr:hypothetical protein [Anatilimnocola floriformis]
MYLALAAVLCVMAQNDSGTSKVPVTIAGGHEIGREDHGRPCILIAAGLGVKTEVFREAFSGVTPAKGGPPSEAEKRANKSALLKVLSPHKVSNERLDEVSNYYRYQPQRGELWPTTAAKAHAVVENGKVTKIVVDEPGSGYCSLPQLSVKGFPDLQLKATLHLDKDLKKNGGIEAIELSK